jgi:hypothetical protein
LSNGTFATSSGNRCETKRERLLCPPLRTSAIIGPRFEHLDFFNSDMLQLFAFDIRHRPGHPHRPVGLNQANIRELVGSSLVRSALSCPSRWRLLRFFLKETGHLSWPFGGDGFWEADSEMLRCTNDPMNAPNVSFAKSISAVMRSCKSPVPCNEVPVPCNEAAATGTEAAATGTEAAAAGTEAAAVGTEAATPCNEAPAPCTQTPINQIDAARMVKNIVRAAVSNGRPDSPNFVMFPVNPYRLTNFVNISNASLGLSVLSINFTSSFLS